ncbi:MAG: DUF1559 domain-containing protein [Opitutaceae bacterium]|jgi:general secretion pathway protein G
MRSRPRAFTLIELLAVVAIVGVLAALVVGSVSKIRDAARRSTCASNLRQIGAAFQLYAADNKGLYPAPRMATYPYPVTPPGGGSYTKQNPPPGVNPSGENWQVEISRYVVRDQNYIWDVKDIYGQANIAHCPSYDLFFNTAAKMSSQSNISTAGYGMNVNLNVNGSNYSGTTWGKENTLRFRAIGLTYPATTILVGDSANFFITLPWTADPSFLDGYGNAAPKRHGATANYLYADGHVAALPLETAIVAVAYKP